jgi:hypothetical protein
MGTPFPRPRCVPTEAKEGSAIMKFEQERNALADVLNKKEPLTPADIRLLRENVDGAVFAGR